MTTPSSSFSASPCEISSQTYATGTHVHARIRDYAFSRSRPEMLEEDVFRVLVHLIGAFEEGDTAQVTEQVSARVTAQVPKEVAIQSTMQATEHVTEQATEHVTEHVMRLLHCLVDEPKQTQALMSTLGLHHRPTFVYSYAKPAMEWGLIEMTQPDAPKSPTQKYRLTEKGRQILQGKSHA